MTFCLKIFILLIFISSSPTQADSNQQLDIFYPSFSMLEDVQKRSNTVSDDYFKIVQYLKSTGLSYKFYSAPWKRALLNSNNSTNALIIYLNRTPERESSYHWLLRLGYSQNIIYGPIDLIDENLTINTLKHIGGVAVCIRGSEQCNSFRKIGFSEKNDNLVVSSSSEVMSHELAKKGRADYFIVDKDYFEKEIKGDILLQTYKELFPLKKTGIYMAAPKSIDKSFLKKLSSTIPTP